MRKLIFLAVAVLSALVLTTVEVHALGSNVTINNQAFLYNPDIPPSLDTPAIRIPFGSPVNVSGTAMIGYPVTIAVRSSYGSIVDTKNVETAPNDAAFSTTFGSEKKLEPGGYMLTYEISTYNPGEPHDFAAFVVKENPLSIDATDIC